MSNSITQCPALREFLAIGLDEAPLDHSTRSRTRRLAGGDVRKAVFDFMLREIGVDPKSETSG